MSDSFNICHCGNAETPHNFRHLFKPVAEVKFTEERDMYTFDASNFPCKETESCSIPFCKYPKHLHRDEPMREIMQGETMIAFHKYVPSINNHRDFSFSLPQDSTCRVCKQLLSKCHEEYDKIDHLFTTKVVVKNIRENDILTIVNRANDDQVIKNDLD